MDKAVRAQDDRRPAGGDRRRVLVAEPLRYGRACAYSRWPSRFRSLRDTRRPRTEIPAPIRDRSEGADGRRVDDAGPPGPWRGEDRDLFRQLVEAALID